MFIRRVSFDDFIFAVRVSITDIIGRYIDENRTNPTAIDTKKDGNTALFLAAQVGNIEVVRLLLTAGAAVNTANKAHYTALMSAAFGSHTEVVRLLLAAGAAINTPNRAGDTALFLAAFNGHIEVIRLLLAAGAAIDTTNQSGNTALMSAAFGSHTEVVSFLLAAGAAIDTTNQSGNTALMSAAFGSRTEVVRLLLAAGAAINTANHAGNTALIGAAINGHTEVVRLLLAAGAAINTPNRDGDTVLIGAAINGHTEVIRLLLAAGAAINTPNHAGDTALIRAAAINRTEVVCLLLAAGADPTLKNKQNETAEKCAINDEIRRVLRDAMVTPEMKLEAFEEGQAGLVKTQLMSPEDLEIKAQLEVKLEKAVSKQVEPELTDKEIRLKAQLEKEALDRQRASALAFKAATKQLNFLQDNGMGNSELLPDLLMCFSQLLLTIGEKESDEYSRVLIKLAAEKGDSLARHIDSTFKQNTEIEIEIQKEIEINKKEIAKANKRERVMQAKFKTFGSEPSSPPVSTMNHDQQAEKKEIADPMNVELSSFSPGNSK